MCTVLDCLWVQDNLECFNTAGYEFNRTVTNKLTIWIPRAYPNMTGEYYCKLADSTAFNIQHCQLVLTDGNFNFTCVFFWNVLCHDISVNVNTRGFNTSSVSAVVYIIAYNFGTSLDPYFRY